MPSKSKKLLDQVRETILLKHYSRKTEKTYVSWIRRFILFYGKKHPQEMGEREIEAFLSHLAVNRNGDDIISTKPVCRKRYGRRCS